ncbi:hypothetical protein PVAND_016014 [Polypedilum vanderplanki]|uniref:CHK kinase-like domain-containing protein n=1 Tax=Polypedilum vanderplanki TaxID=319348 RepID=A0A9J6BED2_POLVA|nr:hypothetical protein PVAND_016014 [Polypedilum vanderplanki]
MNFDNNSDWIDKNFISAALKSFENCEEIEIIDFYVTPSENNQSSYNSVLYHASITYKQVIEIKHIFVVIKAQPFIENSQHDGDEKTFHTETQTYKILSEIQSLMHSIGDKEVLCPKLIYETIKPRPAIVLEDVNKSGFETMIEEIPMDFEFSKMVARKLGKFHAGSFYLQKQRKFSPSNFTFSIYQDFQCINMLFDKPLRIFIEVLSTWKGYEKFIEPLREFRKNFASQGVRSYTRNRGNFAFNVLNHGDFNARNVLFKKNEKNGKFCDMIMLDFQACVFATPAVDLTYALYNFLSDENRQKYRDEFLAIYHQQFVDSLKKFGYKKQPPSLIDLQVEMIRNGNLQVISAICLKYLSYFDYKTLEPDDLANGMRSIKEKAFNSDGFKKMISEELPRFLYCGIIPMEEL